jgi:hypothetical protein
MYNTEESFVILYHNNNMKDLILECIIDFYACGLACFELSPKLKVLK